jgi:hypothetical protein
MSEKNPKLYSLEHSRHPKAFSTPHNIRRCCTNVVRGYCCVLGDYCTNVSRLLWPFLRYGHLKRMLHRCRSTVPLDRCYSNAMSGHTIPQQYELNHAGNKRKDREAWPAHKMFFAYDSMWRARKKQMFYHYFFLLCLEYAGLWKQSD